MNIGHEVGYVNVNSLEAACLCTLTSFPPSCHPTRLTPRAVKTQGKSFAETN